MHRFKTLVHFLFVSLDAIALAVGRWMDELDLWLDIVFGPEEAQHHDYAEPIYGGNFDVGGYEGGF